MVNVVKETVQAYSPSKLNVVLEKSLKMVAIFRVNPVLDQLPILASSFHYKPLSVRSSPLKKLWTTQQLKLGYNNI